MGMILTFGFGCNLRAIYMRVFYDKPLETAEEIYKSDNLVYLLKHKLHYLNSSNNVWDRRLANSDKIRIMTHETESEILKGIARDGVGVALTCFRDYIFMMMNAPDAKSLTNVHFSPVITDYGGWTVEKTSPWREAINRHILLLDQVNYF